MAVPILKQSHTLIASIQSALSDRDLEEQQSIGEKAPAMVTAAMMQGDGDAALYLAIQQRQAALKADAALREQNRAADAAAAAAADADRARDEALRRPT